MPENFLQSGSPRMADIIDPLTEIIDPAICDWKAATNSKFKGVSDYQCKFESHLYSLDKLKVEQQWDTIEILEEFHTCLSYLEGVTTKEELAEQKQSLPFLTIEEYWEKVSSKNHPNFPAGGAWRKNQYLSTYNQIGVYEREFYGIRTYQMQTYKTFNGIYNGRREYTEEICNQFKAQSQFVDKVLFWPMISENCIYRSLLYPVLAVSGMNKFLNDQSGIYNWNPTKPLYRRGKFETDTLESALLVKHQNPIITFPTLLSTSKRKEICNSEISGNLMIMSQVSPNRALRLYKILDDPNYSATRESEVLLLPYTGFKVKSRNPLGGKVKDCDIYDETDSYTLEYTDSIQTAGYVIGDPELLQKIELIKDKYNNKKKKCYY